MKWIGISKLFTLGMLVVALGGFQLACSKPETREAKDVVHESPVKEAAPDTKAEKKEEKAEEKPEKKEEKAEEKAEDKDDKKVTNVKDAFIYTGKEMDKGFKKAGSSIKKAFVGDDKD